MLQALSKVALDTACRDRFRSAGLIIKKSILSMASRGPELVAACPDREENGGSTHPVLEINAGARSCVQDYRRKLAGPLRGEVAVGNWVLVGQTLIDEFAALTGDEQWIHTDTERARRESPFRTTIAHGYLILSLLPKMVGGIFAKQYHLCDARLVVNAGIDRAVFLKPVQSNTRIMGVVSLISATFDGKQAILVNRVDVVSEINDSPVCTLEMRTVVYL